MLHCSAPAGNGEPEQEVLVNRAYRLAVWSKGWVVPGYDPAVWRRDQFGRFMKFDEYGLRPREHAWEIDHIIRERDGGSHHISNLRPLNWRSNAERQ